MKSVAAILLLLQSADAGIRIDGNRIVSTKTGKPVMLRGVNRDGGEYGCVQGLDIFDDTTYLDDSEIAAIQSWGNNIIRIPMNEDCWLGLFGPDVSANEYRNAITETVNNIIKRDMYVILDLHWTDPSGLATGQEPLPDTSNSPNFWESVASTFNYSRSDMLPARTSRPAVLFTLILCIAVLFSLNCSMSRFRGLFRTPPSIRTGSAGRTDAAIMVSMLLG